MAYSRQMAHRFFCSTTKEIRSRIRDIHSFSIAALLLSVPVILVSILIYDTPYPSSAIASCVTLSLILMEVYLY
jgi:hypothetical protein